MTVCMVLQNDWVRTHGSLGLFYHLKKGFISVFAGANLRIQQTKDSYGC